MPNGIRRANRRLGFTIIELLVVIGIIVVLLGILLPVVNSVRKSAQKTDTAALLSKLATSIHNYYQDYRAFPGPLADSSTYGFNYPTQSSWPVTPAISGLTGGTNISSSQNLVLGLIGGVTAGGTVAAPTFTYNPTLVGQGPQSLNVANPQQIQPYFDVNVTTELSNDGAGKLVSWTTQNNSKANASLTAIPEFMDHFSNPHPIIYLRARVGAVGSIDNTPIPPSQYYSKEMAPYWVGGSNAVPTTPTPGTPFPSQPDTNNGNQQLYTSAQSFFNNTTVDPNGYTPRNKDTFILISAGYDGIYGTTDDVVYPPN